MFSHARSRGADVCLLGSGRGRPSGYSVSAVSPGGLVKNVLHSTAELLALFLLGALVFALFLFFLLRLLGVLVKFRKLAACHRHHRWNDDARRDEIEQRCDMPQQLCTVRQQDNTPVRTAEGRGEKVKAEADGSSQPGRGLHLGERVCTVLGFA